MLTLERYEDAVARDAGAYCEITGYGVSNDAHHMSAPREDGAQTARAIELALREAEVDPSTVEAINAHGSSTKLGDRAESLAYARVFGERSARIPLSATKGQHGHALGATGAWEIALSALSMKHRLIPGAVNFRTVDEECAVGCSREALELDPNIILSNSSGFGGINAALVLQKV